jgi:flagellum-specific peptidoglycan hydrolase FlgJ
MRIVLKLILGLLILLVASCGPKKGIITKKKSQKDKIETVKKSETSRDDNSITESNKTTKPPTNTEKYIELYADIAMAEMRKSKIPASITLAQGILESASGRGRLAVEANNHFGIKCHGWNGKKIYHDDDRSQECFRKYNYVQSSYEDHSDFLTSRKRYSKLFELKPNDYKGWAKGLKAAGYATDRKYPAKLISLIERYQLYKYDDFVLGNKDENKDEVKNAIKHVVVKGDTLYSLSKKYNTTIEAIKQKNNLKSNDLSIGQELIIANK